MVEEKLVLEKGNRELDLSQFDSSEYIGIIQDVSFGKLREFVPEEYWDKYVDKKGKTNLDKEVVHLEIKCNEELIPENLTIPKISGYVKSNMKKVRDKNPNLPLKVGASWIGETVKLGIEVKGQKSFLKLAL